MIRGLIKIKLPSLVGLLAYKVGDSTGAIAYFLVLNAVVEFLNLKLLPWSAVVHVLIWRGITMRRLEVLSQTWCSVPGLFARNSLAMPVRYLAPRHFYGGISGEIYIFYRFSTIVPD